MMNLLPTVVGAIATNYEGDISNDKGTPILFGTDYEHLDRHILQTFIKQETVEKSVIVIGKNTYKQSSKMLNRLAPSATILQVGFDGMMDEPLSGSRRVYIANMQRVYEFATAINATNIVVLGGRSVYNMFKGHYSRFVHVIAPTDEMQNGKPVAVTPNCNAAEYLEGNFLKRRPVLIPGMTDRWKIIYDANGFQVREFNIRGK